MTWPRNLDMRPGETNADYCRRRGWGPGTRLTGTEGVGTEWEHTDTITITAIGRDKIFAVADGRDDREGNWTLECRDWQVQPDQLPTPASERP